MKLRNKKTGDVIDERDIGWTISIMTGERIYRYDSLAELNEEWEDYEPKEPFIKDGVMQQQIIDLSNRVAKLERQTARSQSHIPESSIGKWF